MKNKFGIHKDFPIEGVSFLDINPILNNNRDLRSLENKIIKSVSHLEDIDYIVVIESRGFLFGTSLAKKLNAGLVLARKSGKLPGEVYTDSYSTEYSESTLQLQKNSIKPGSNVLIFDDILATGGTALSTKRLVELCGAKVAAFSFIGDISILGGEKLLQDNSDPECSVIKVFNF